MRKRSDKYKISKLKLFLLIVLTIIALIGCVFIWARFISTSGLIVNEIKVVKETLPESFNGLKVVHLSDIHYGKTINKNKLERVVEKINLINPDIVVFTGDLIDKDIDITNKMINDISKTLKKIDSKYGKYSVKGNHDYSSDSFLEIMENSDFYILENGYDLIYNEKKDFIYIGGLSSSIKTNIDYEKTLEYFNIETNNKDIFRLMLMHEPDNIDNVLEYQSMDLALAGHSHGGQIRLPYFGPMMKVKDAKKYPNSHYKINNTDLYVSYGLGTTTYPFRLFNKPSINFYRIYNK
ncbi:MAG: metallophosphoesterase [Bacilli bacterium]|nr:metallophosphoesterase [Bacilli bacterium]